ncbi:HalOD1 output domain-containing protein [Halobiforma nitratireducens]|uniref:HalOD1 output domain-containing protein n=1 Tax=Halobiforma nitratireducens TaxID=130048 RepID=UPI00373AF505
MSDSRPYPASGPDNYPPRLRDDGRGFALALALGLVRRKPRPSHDLLHHHPALDDALERTATREDCALTALPPLYDAVEPETVAVILESPADATVRFEYAGYRVTVATDDAVVTDGEQ